jgi:hypothetical protein
MSLSRYGSWTVCLGLASNCEPPDLCFTSS